MPSGNFKDMAARSLLLKLERRGLLCLPPRQRPGTANHRACRLALEPELPLDRIYSALAPLRPLRVRLVDNEEGRRDFTRLLQQKWQRKPRILMPLPFSQWETSGRQGG